MSDLVAKKLAELAIQNRGMRPLISKSRGKRMAGRSLIGAVRVILRFTRVGYCGCATSIFPPVSQYESAARERRPREASAAAAALP